MHSKKVFRYIHWGKESIAENIFNFRLIWNFFSTINSFQINVAFVGIFFNKSYFSFFFWTIFSILTALLVMPFNIFRTKLWYSLARNYDCLKPLVAFNTFHAKLLFLNQNSGIIWLLDQIMLWVLCCNFPVTWTYTVHLASFHMT